MVLSTRTRAGLHACLSGDNMKAQQIKAFVQGDGTFVLNSSFNPRTWFLFEETELNDLFPASGELISGEEP